MSEKEKCPFCGGDDIYPDNDIGWDIYTTNDKDVIEEKQHRDVCRNCNAWRFRFQPISARDGALPITLGKWTEYDKEMAFYMGF